jgi:hypothetical protein
MLRAEPATRHPPPTPTPHPTPPLQVDYEADFIDDSEVVAISRAKRLKTKHSGFFLNQVGGGQRRVGR